jgi:hypothetical protein
MQHVPFEFHSAKGAQLTIEVAVKKGISKVTFHSQRSRERNSRDPIRPNFTLGTMSHIKRDRREPDFILAGVFQQRMMNGKACSSAAREGTLRGTRAK